MLDDLKAINDLDKSDTLGLAAKQWQQLTHRFTFDAAGLEGICNVVLAGMGGSAFPGLFVKSWPGTLLPFEIIRDYSLPAYVGQDSLVIISSYSGNTEETLSALDDAEGRGARIVILAAGGKLVERAHGKHLLVTIPPVIQPRMAAFYFWGALVQLFEGLKIVTTGSSQELVETGSWLQGQTADWLPEIPVSRNPAKQLAQELMGLSLVFYAGPKLFAAANKWKICTNENAKTVAWTNSFSEYNHNEFIGWSGQPIDKPYAVIEIRSNLEHPQIQKRFELSERLLSGKRPSPHIVIPQGETLPQQLAWTSNFADFVSLYLALLNNVDPAPVGLVEKLKKELV